MDLTIYAIANVSDELLKSYTPTKIDFTLDFNNINDFRFYRGEEKVSRYSIQAGTEVCNSSFSDWSIVGEFLEPLNLFCTWPSCISSPVPEMGAFNLQSYGSYYHSKFTTYNDLLENDLYNQETRPAGWEGGEGRANQF